MTTVIGTCRLCSRLSRTLFETSHGRASNVSYQSVRDLKHFQEKTVRIMYWRDRSFDRLHVDKKRTEFQDWNYRSEIFAFSRRLQENLDENTLRQVFIHPSYVDEYRARQIALNMPDIYVKSNTDLVGRGDVLLNDCIEPYLRFTFNKMPEDGVVAIKNYLKSDQVLADVAKWIGCKDIILSTDYPPEQSTMANTVKALVAGIEKDMGSKRVQRFVVDMILSYLNDKDILDDIWTIPNPKDTLNLILANSKLPNYEPRIMFQTGIRTVESCHMVGLYCNKRFLGSSAGETLEIAEETAALDSLQRMFDLKESRQPYIYGEDSEKIDYDAHRDQHRHIEKYQISL